MLKSGSLTIHSDGGSRGNPGHAAVGYTVESDNTLVYESGLYIGIGTNNEAEHLAIQEALCYVAKSLAEITEIDCYLDSELVVYQLQGKYKIKNQRLAEIARVTMQTIAKLRSRGISVRLHAIPRHLNKRADALVNKALDEHLGL